MLDHEFMGAQCEKVNECFRNPCQNSGTCRPDDNGIPICTCPKAFRGEFCEKSFSCEKNACKNGGQCQVVDNTSFSCKCPKNFFGIDCGIKITKEICEAEEPSICNVKSKVGECDLDEVMLESRPWGLVCPKRCNLCESFICADSFEFCYIFTKTLKCGMFANVCKQTCGLCGE